MPLGGGKCRLGAPGERAKSSAVRFDVPIPIVRGAGVPRSGALPALGMDDLAEPAAALTATRRGRVDRGGRSQPRRRCH